MKDIIQLARDLGTEIQKSQVYKDVLEHKTKSDQDSVLQQIIGEFNLKKIALNTEATKPKGEEDIEKINMLNDQVRELYSQIVTNHNMVNYNQSKHDLSLLMTNINKILSAAIDGQDPQTVELNDDNNGCGGSCSSCSGCS